MFIQYGILFVGFLLLIKGADLFVEGSSGIAKVFKVPSLIIGLTIVALGTSAPELAVSTVAALHDANEIALSNVIGSNLFNILVVLGLCSIFTSVPVEEKVIKRDLPFSILFYLFMLIVVGLNMIFRFGIENVTSLHMEDEIAVIGRVLGVILLLIFIIYIYYIINDAIKNPIEVVEEEINISIYKCIIFIIIGIVMIVFGGQFVVDSAKSIALSFGMSETLVGLTIVAVGTSLPELITSIVAAKKNELDLAVGNVIGSNIFNFLFILGLPSILNPIEVNFASFIDLIILFFINILTLIFALTRKKITMREGVVLLLIYLMTIMMAYTR